MSPRAGLCGPHPAHGVCLPHGTSWGFPGKKDRSSAAHLRGEQSAEREDNKLVGADLQRIQGSLQGPLGQDRIAQIAKTSE